MPLLPHVDDSTLPLGTADEAAPFGGTLGRYVVERPLGCGGMGIVVAAHDPTLGRTVALKLLRAETEQTRARMELEAQAMARLAHPNVVTVYEVDRVDGRTFVAMELVDGWTLRDWLTAKRRTWHEIAEMFVAAGRGLAAAHAAGLVHRDFKPDNVLLGHDGRPRVCDFGLASHVDAAPDPITSDPSSAVGTPGYMSPEQWRAGPVDARSDQFAFCVALWEALWDQRPFAGDTPAALRGAAAGGAVRTPGANRRVPRRIERILRRGLSIDPAARWPDMSALLAELTRAPPRRRFALVATAALASVAAAATTALILGAASAARSDHGGGAAAVGSSFCVYRMMSSLTLAP